MSKLQDLIKELCPEGVEFRKLGEVCEIKRGVRVVKNDLLKNGKYPVYQNSLTPLGYYDQNNYPANTTFIISAGAAGEIGYTEEPIWAADDCLTITSPKNISSKFIYYYLIANKLFFISKVRRASVPRLSRTVVENFEIPIPPLEIQNEIVRILDTFTSHTAELQAELQARKEQYEYYRNKLLTFDENDEGIKWRKLGDLFDFKNGLNKGKEFFGKGSSIVNFTDVYNKRALYKETLKGKVEVNIKEILRYNVHKGDVFFTRTSETPNDIGMSSVMMDEVENCVFSGFVLRGRPKTQLLLPKYCAYCFSTNQVRKEIIRNSSYTTRALTSGTNLSKISIPIPPLAEQQRIVSILDKFEALVNDLSAGLPAEIAAVQEQYEYYRNKLLTFERKS